MRHDAISISKSNEFHWFYKDWTAFIKLPNFTAVSNISFAIIFTNIFTKQKSFQFSYFVNPCPAE